MKSTFKTILVSVSSAFITVFVFDNYFNQETIISPNATVKLIPTAYSYNTNGMAAEMTDFTIAAEKTVNGVVHVKNTSTQKGNGSWWFNNLYGEDNGPKRVGTGSGVIISPDGMIITNHHVIKDASEIQVTTNKNKSYMAKLIGSDPNTDLAVLKIDTDENLPYISFGDSESSKIGEWVLAVGNPFNLNSTVTAGIISAKSRDLNDTDQKNQSFIQTDAAVNMGNSGGALVNTKGELIGINTAISSISGGFVGYSFAVPSNTVRKVFEDIIEYGNVQKGLLGVQGNALNADFAEKFEISDTEGFYIGDVEKGLGADLVGLKQGDIIKKVDGTTINKFSDLTGYLSTKRPGDKVKVFYKSGGKNKDVMVTLKKTNRTRFIGMELKNLSEEEKATFKIEKGVVISKMLNSRLYNYDIEEGFVVLEVNDILIDEVATIESITLESLSSILFLSPDGQKERILFE